MQKDPGFKVRASANTPDTRCPRRIYLYHPMWARRYWLLLHRSPIYYVAEGLYLLCFCNHKTTKIPGVMHARLRPPPPMRLDAVLPHQVSHTQEYSYVWPRTLKKNAFPFASCRVGLAVLNDHYGLWRYWYGGTGVPSQPFRHAHTINSVYSGVCVWWAIQMFFHRLITSKWWNPNHLPTHSRDYIQDPKKTSPLNTPRSDKV